VVVVVTGTHGRVSTGGTVGGGAVVVVVGTAVVVVLVVVVGGSVVVLVVVVGPSVGVGGVAATGRPTRPTGAPRTSAINTARAVDEDRLQLDIKTVAAGSRRFCHPPPDKLSVADLPGLMFP
jgi:hypothetical protein